jgi:hypothetical protein
MIIQPIALVLLYFLILIVNSFAIVGIHKITREGMIFGWVQDIQLPEMIQKPLFDCPTCMASIHSIVPFWFTTYLITGVTEEIVVVSVVAYIYYALALVCVSTLMNRLFED